MTSIPDLLPHEFEAVLGKTGSGKSNRAKIAVEAWITQGRRVGIIDITDAWWGLKLRADGKAPAHDIVIFGGRHADVDLAPAMAAPLGQMLAKATFPWILCTAKLGENAMRAFLSDFFEALYLHLESPLHLIMDEADEYAPQTTTGAIGELFGRVDRIVRRGRVKGFRVMVLTQRPAALNKNILAQADRLTAFKLTLPHDHAAIEGWIKGHGDKKRGQQVLDTLAGLRVGTAWVWAPEHGMLEQVAFPLAKTFDSGRSPDGTATQPTTALKPADLEKLRAQLGAVIEEAKANDPKRLRAEIARLQQELRTGGGASAAEVETARNEAYASGRADGQRALQAFIRNHISRLNSLREEVTHKIAVALQGLEPHLTEEVAPTPAPPKSALPAPQRATSPTPPRKSPTPAGDLTGPQQRILDALAELEAIGARNPSRIFVANLAGYGNITSTGFAKAIGALKVAGHVEYPIEGAIGLTPTGAALASPADRPLSSAALQQRVMAFLSGPGQKMLAALIASYPDDMSREDLMRVAGYSNATSTGFVKALGRLRALGFANNSGTGRVVAAPSLFVEGR